MRSSKHWLRILTGSPRLRKWWLRDLLETKSCRKSDRSARKLARRSKMRGIASRQNRRLRRSSVSVNKMSRGDRRSWPSSKNVTHTTIKSNSAKSFWPTAIMKKRNLSQTKMSSRSLPVWACSHQAKAKMMMTTKRARKKLRRLWTTCVVPWL